MMSEEYLGLGGQEKLKNTDPDPPRIDPLAERLYVAHEHWEQHDGPTPDMFTMFANECRAFLAERVTTEKIVRVLYVANPRTEKWPSWADLDAAPALKDEWLTMAAAVLALLRREVRG